VLLALVLFALITAAGVAASVWFSMKTTELLAARLPVSDLAQWGEQSTRLALVAITTRTVALASGFLYGSWRWWSLNRSVRAR
jgi:hypothetical protein